MSHFFQTRVFGACILGGALFIPGARLVKGQEPNAPLPLVGKWSFDGTTGNALSDSGPNKLNGQTGGAAVVEGKSGQALRFDNGQAARIGDNPLLRGGDKFTLSLWMKLAQKPTYDMGIVAKRDQNSSSPFILSINKRGFLGFEGFDGSDWIGLWPDGGAVPVGEWAHVALTYEAKGEAVLYLNGKPVSSRRAGRALAGNDQGLLIGKDPYRGNFNGAIDEVQIFAAALTAPQNAAIAAGQTLPTRAATVADFAPPAHVVELVLARYDLPRARTEGLGRTRLNAERIAGPNAVDWPQISHRDSQGQTQNVFEKGASQKIEVPLRVGDAARGHFQKANDEAVFPGNHWFRPLEWLWGRRYVYSTDRTARSLHNEFEIWTFPIQISGPIRSVALKNDGKEIYNRVENLESLTLLLPQNEGGKPYEISVNGAPFQSFDAGLLPITLGNPQQKRIPLDLAFAGGISVKNLDRPATFPYQKEWDETLAAMKNGGEQAKFARAPMAPLSGFNRYLGLDVPRSPLEIYTVALPHGMSGGHFMRSEHKPHAENASADPKATFEGSADEYARFLRDTGYDMVYEMSANDAFDGQGERSYEELARSLRAQGLKFGVSPGVTWKRPFIAHPNLGLFALTLPDYRAPLYRDVQLLTQRLGAYGNFDGVSLGADNAAYESFWGWAPPEPGRPWGEAFTALAAEGKSTVQRPLAWPETKGLGGQASVREFQEYIARYDKSFDQYGYFDRALRSIDPKFSATTGSYGSSPGVGARGGYPWATIPAKNLFSGLSVMQAYDWNEVASSKPLHNVALLDRARSHYPNKELRSLVDDFGLFFGREARQRAYLLSLTRGIDTIGTQFLGSPYNAKPKVYTEQKELFEWAKSRGGAFVGTRPDAQIGILYINGQALLRGPNKEANPSDEALFNGSHEGKTTEALILAHAAGFPAKIVTPDELRRGLPAEMKAVLLVGLHREDATWNWSDGMEADFQKFIAGGGKILRDFQSVSPVTSVETGLKIRAYIAQGAGTEGNQDRMPQILERNTENIALLQRVMAGVTAPVAKSTSSTIWAVPHTTGDVQYVTVVNWGYEPGQNASKIVKPQAGELQWNTSKPIYNVKSLRAVAPSDAQKVDLTKDGFALYAVPSRALTTPKIQTNLGADSFYSATVDVNGMRGVPMQLQLVRGSETATLSGASGEAIALPIRAGEAGITQITATELLSGKKASATLVAMRPAPNGGARLQNVALSDAPQTQNAELKKFFARRAPLTLALTPTQAADPKIKALTARLTKASQKMGRKIEIGELKPNGVVLHPQSLVTSQKFPLWTTSETDLILLGNPSDNPLIFDQKRGHLLPDSPNALHVTYSPFVGEFNVLNLLANDAAGLARLTAQIEAAN